MDFTTIQFNQMRHEEMRRAAEVQQQIVNEATAEATTPFYANALVQLGKTLSNAGAALQETYGRDQEAATQRPSNA